MSEPICECGHPQHRHAFKAWHCTVNERTPGVGFKSCHCPEFRPKKTPLDKPQPEVEE